jgi:type II secretory pathway pseudopilin PulG
MKSDAQRSNRKLAGFTLTEFVVAASLGTLVASGMATSFIWSLKTASECRQYAWAQTEGIKSSQRVLAYFRNAVAVTNIDAGGDWIEIVSDTNNTVARFTFQNPTTESGKGKVIFVADVSDPTSPTNVIVDGVTKVISTPQRNVFEQTGPDSLRMAYRITKPLRSGEFPAEVDVGVRLRNH